MDKSNKNLRRNRGVYLRFTESEKAEVQRRARSNGLSMDEFGRCKMLDIPFEYVSGRMTRKPASPRRTPRAQSHKSPDTATIPTA